MRPSERVPRTDVFSAQCLRLSGTDEASAVRADAAGWCLERHPHGRKRKRARRREPGPNKRHSRDGEARRRALGSEGDDGCRAHSRAPANLPRCSPPAVIAYRCTPCAVGRWSSSTTGCVEREEHLPSEYLPDVECLRFGDGPQAGLALVMASDGASRGELLRGEDSEPHGLKLGTAVQEVPIAGND